MISALIGFTIDLDASNSLQVPSFLDTTAIIVGAMVGAMGATRKGLDVLGVLIIAFCTGIGGGLIRDILLQNGIPVILQNPNYQLFACVGAFVGLFFAKGASKFTPVYDALDTFMIGVWVLLGCGKALDLGLSLISVVFVGTIAAVGGALLKDVLCHDMPSIVQPGYWYTLAAFFSATSFAVMLNYNVRLDVAQVIAVAVAASARIISVKFKIRTPTPNDVSEWTLRTLHLSRD